MAIIDDDRPVMKSAPRSRPEPWKFSDRLWNLSRRLTPQSVDYFLRFRSANAIPQTMRSRFEAMLIPEETISRCLGEVHRLDDWVGAWNRAAQRFMAESRREEQAGDWDASWVARRNAAMCYHAAHLITEDDPRVVRALRASAVQAFSQSMTRLVPATRRVGIPWRTRRLPAYLTIPTESTTPAPVIVMLNGATTTKEETFLWSLGLQERGFAVIALDWPGTGEAIDGMPLSSYCDDMTDGIFQLIESEPDLASGSVAFFGVSLGAVVALRAAANDRRVGAVVALTPPYDPRPWMSAINPLVAQQLVSLAGQTQSLPVLIADFSLPDVIDKVRCPVLVFGAARDLVVPPDESLKLTSALGTLGTLVWYQDGAHGLYDRIDDWSDLTGTWLEELFDMGDSGAAKAGIIEDQSTRVDQVFQELKDAIIEERPEDAEDEPTSIAQSEDDPDPVPENEKGS
ncbi:hypothetical protein BH23CHL5_BH23CHL5_02660 [soil metagenome]